MAITNDLINPWKRISSDGAFILDEDRRYVESFNQAYKEFHGSKVDGLINLSSISEGNLQAGAFEKISASINSRL